MSPDAQLKQALFEAARHLSTPAERRAYLDRACADDAELRQHIEALLELEAPASEYFGDLPSPPPGHRSPKPNGQPDPEEGSGRDCIAD